MAVRHFEATIDSHMDGVNNKDTNYGTDQTLFNSITYLGGDKAFLFRPIGNFDVSPVAGLTINSAKLVREITSVTNGGFSAILSRCTRPADWTEGGVTWNKYDGTNAWTDAGGDFDDTGPPAKIDYTEPTATGEHEITGLKDFVTDAIDNRSNIVSIIMRHSDENPASTTGAQFRSVDNGADIWHLVVDYTPATARPVANSGALGSANVGIY